MRIRTIAAIAGAVLASVFAEATGAHADLKIDQTVTSSVTLPGADNSNPTHTVLYYKGDKSRVDTGNKATISDATSNKVYRLDTVAKTYFESTPADLALQSSSPALAGAQFGGSADVIDTGEEKQIAGKTAHHYRFEMNITVSAPDNPVMAAILPSLELDGDEWTIAVPDAIAGVAKMQGVSVLNHLPGGMGKGLQPLIDKMSEIKGIGVEIVQSMKEIPNPNAPDAAKGQPAPEPVIITTKTTSVSEDPLPDTLFAIPDDYKKVDPPSPGAPVH